MFINKILENKFFVLITLSWVILGIISWYLIFNKNNSIKVDKYIKNNTWNVPLSKDVPYKKWDEVELIYILRNWVDILANININKLKKLIEISEINYNWKKYKNLKEIEILKDPKILKIIWKAKVNHNIWEEINELEIIKIKEIEIVENEEKIIKEDVTEVPVNIKISNNYFSSNINNILILNWQNIDNIDFVLIWEKSFKPIIEDNIAYIPIEKNTFNSWEYFILIQSKTWEIKSINNKIKFNYINQKINIAHINPIKIWNKIDNYIILQWNWFNKLISLQLSNNIILENAQFQIINDNVVMVKIPKNISEWNYTFNLMDIDWIYEDDKILTITN